MRVRIKKWGNSASVRIPSGIMQAAHLELNQLVDMRADNDCIIIEPVQQPEFDLALLVAGITSQNLHEEANFDMSVGKEV